MVAVVFKGQKMPDDRGERHPICMIWRATRVSGYDKGYLVRSDETSRFWLTFLITGVPFASLMIAWNWMVPLLTGGSTSVDYFSSRIQSQFWFHLIVFGGIMGGYFKLYTWRSAKAARRAMLRAELCVSCAYPLDGCQPEPDGCTVCPECGAAWRLKA